MARKNVRLTHAELRDLLDSAYERYARPEFIADDPIHIPRSFGNRADAEVIGFLTATIAWGQRITIINNARKLVTLMDGAPHDFVMNAAQADLSRLDRFVHRTFNGIDARHFIRGIRHLYERYGGLENSFLEEGEVGDMGSAIARFKARFFEPTHQARTRKHVADPSKGSNAKRINMYLRWMVRPDDRGVDLGLWKRIPASALHVPLDVHTGRVAREIGLLRRAQDDWKSVIELTGQLREFDPRDPIRYDIALFGIGIDHSKAMRVTRSVPRSSTARSR